MGTLGSYKTAWTLHKLRRAMVRPGRDRLVDETYLGGVEEGVRGRQTESKALIVVAAQEDGKGIGRIRMRRILDASAESLMPFVEDAIVPGSVVHTDTFPRKGKATYTGSPSYRATRNRRQSYAAGSSRRVCSSVWARTRGRSASIWITNEFSIGGHLAAGASCSSASYGAGAVQVHAAPAKIQDHNI